MTIEVHTSDRGAFRRCRRKWSWASPMRGNLTQEGSTSGPLWMGTGFHFALEDYHGLNRFGHPTDAFLAFQAAHRESQLPEDHNELTELACEMLAYYVDSWSLHHEQFETLQLDNGPAVEVRWRVPLFDGVDYVGTFDRVVRDSEGRLWIMDYKTAARIETGNLETDAQVSAYTAVGRYLYGERVEGVIWLQFLKKKVKEPEVLVNGELSQNKTKAPPYWVYHKALIERFGEVPARYHDFMSHLLDQSSENGDDYIFMNRIRRSPQSTNNTWANINHEVQEMLNPDLPLYPNPTRDCSWDCPFRVPCITLEDGYDYQDILETNFFTRLSYSDHQGWRARIKWPA